MESESTAALLRQLIQSVNEVKIDLKDNGEKVFRMSESLTTLTVIQREDRSRLDNFWKTEWANLLAGHSSLSSKVSSIEKEMSREEGQNLPSRVAALERQMADMQRLKWQVLAMAGAGSMIGGGLLWFFMTFIADKL